MTCVGPFTHITITAAGNDTSLGTESSTFQVDVNFPLQFKEQKIEFVMIIDGVFYQIIFKRNENSRNKFIE